MVSGFSSRPPSLLELPPVKNLRRLFCLQLTELQPAYSNSVMKRTPRLNPVNQFASNPAMKSTSLSSAGFYALTALCLGLNLNSTQAQTPTEAEKNSTPATTNAAPASATVATKPLPTDPAERFQAAFTKATLTGRWAPLEDGALGAERGGDNYHIVSAVPGEGDTWIVSARMKYGGREFVLPIPVKMKFVGDVAILTVDNLAIPYGGTYTARLIIYERTYSGTWKGQRGGGMLYGTITNEE